MAGGTGRAVALVGTIPPQCTTPPVAHHPTAPDPGNSSPHTAQKPAAHRCDACVWLLPVQAEGKRGMWGIFPCCVTRCWIYPQRFLDVHKCGWHRSSLEKQARAIDIVPPGTVQLYPPQHCYAQWEQTQTDAEHLLQTTWFSLETGPSLKPPPYTFR